MIPTIDIEYNTGCMYNFHNLCLYICATVL